MKKVVLRELIEELSKKDLNEQAEIGKKVAEHLAENIKESVKETPKKKKENK